MRASVFLAVAVWLAGCADAPPAHPWPRCEAHAGGESLATKAARFDRLARDWHLGGDGLLRNIELAPDGQTVARYQHAENVILWSGIYLASQALRFEVTGEAAALENARTVLEGLGDLTAVTGVRGLYGRSLDRPDVVYNYNGRGTSSWTDSTAAGYQGWAFRNDVSKDGYDGLMLGYALALEHFTDPDIQQTVRQRIGDVMAHLLEHELQIVDTDGLVTEHGAIYQTAFDDYPGFNALLALSWFKLGVAAAPDDTALADFYDACLLGQARDVTCPRPDDTAFGSYLDSFDNLLYLFLPNCKQNYDNFDMCYQALYSLLRFETREPVRARLLASLRRQMFTTDDPSFQSVDVIGNTWYTFAYAAMTEDGPEDPMLAAAVERAVCMLYDFPAEKFVRAIPAGLQPEVCRNRLDKPVAAQPIPLAEYDFDNFLWRLDFFEIQQARAEDRSQVYSPEDFLLVYWLGRYHGLLAAEQ